MSDTILPIPEIPETIREAAQLGRLVPFVGAGVSKLAGCPNWQELAQSALEFFVTKDKLTYAQLDQISHLNPRVKLSVARSLQEEHQLQIDFSEMIYPASCRSHPDGQAVYTAISALGKTFVTTNYDGWLDEQMVSAPGLSEGSEKTPPSIYIKRNPLYNNDDFTPINLNAPGNVFHLHGSIEDPNSMIMTTQDYISRYANDRISKEEDKENKILTFLEYLFNNKTVLFIGYGLDELEILEYVMLKAKKINKENKIEVKHYLLNGFFSHEAQLVKNLGDYYAREFGIKLLPFLRDARNWGQLLPVLEDFAIKAPASNPTQIQTMQEMEGMLND